MGGGGGKGWGGGCNPHNCSTGAAVVQTQPNGSPRCHFAGDCRVLKVSMQAPLVHRPFLGFSFKFSVALQRP